MIRVHYKICVLDDSSNSLYPAFLMKTFCKTNLYKAEEIYEFIKTAAIKWRLNAGCVGGINKNWKQQNSWHIQMLDRH